MIFTAAQLSALPVLDTCDVLIARGGDAQLACSGDTAARVDDEVMRLIKEAYESALAILKQNTAKLHDLAEYLLEKENISGEEFQRILSQQDEKITPCPPAENRRCKNKTRSITRSPSGLSGRTSCALFSG